MKKLITICAVATMILAIGSVANAHWDSNMPYKMHYPQLPDPYGWDVSSNTVLADDWQCSETGYVKDIHFWVSFKNDIVPPEPWPTIWVGIYSDIPAVPGESYSRPGDLPWSRTFEYGRYEKEYAGAGNQGWLDLSTGEATLNDHTAYYLINIENIEPIEGSPLFQQEKDQIYWLAIQLGAVWGPENQTVGWKTSNDHFMDDAVWYSPVAGWQELKYPECDPRYPGSIDLAFVITPEPTTICLLGLGALSLLRRKRSV